MALNDRAPSVKGYVSSAQYIKGVSDLNQSMKDEQQRSVVNEQNRLNAETSKIFQNRQQDDLTTQRGVLNAQAALNESNSNANILADNARLDQKFAYEKGAPQRVLDAAAAERNRVKQANIDLYSVLNGSAEANKQYDRADLPDGGLLSGAQGPLIEPEQNFIDANNQNPQLHQNMGLIESQTRAALEAEGYSPEQVNAGVQHALRNFTGQSPESAQNSLAASDSLAKAQYGLLDGSGGSGNRSSRLKNVSNAEYDSIQKIFKDLDAIPEASTLDKVANLLSFGINDKDVTQKSLSKLFGYGKTQGVNASSMTMAMKSTNFMNDAEYKGKTPSQILNNLDTTELDELVSVARDIQATGGRSTEQSLSAMNNVYNQQIKRTSQINAQSVPQSLTDSQQQNFYKNFMSEQGINVDTINEKPTEIKVEAEVEPTKISVLTPAKAGKIPSLATTPEEKQKQFNEGKFKLSDVVDSVKNTTKVFSGDASIKTGNTARVAGTPVLASSTSKETQKANSLLKSAQREKEIDSIIENGKGKGGEKGKKYLRYIAKTATTIEELQEARDAYKRNFPSKVSLYETFFGSELDLVDEAIAKLKRK